MSIDKRLKRRLMVGVVMALTTATAQGALQPRGNGLIYDDVLNVTWLKNANLFLELLGSRPTLVADIVAVAPSFTDGFGAPYTVKETDFRTVTDTSGSAGSMTWFGAMAFVNWLNSTTYQGHNDWRLPSVSPSLGADFLYGDQFGSLTCDGSSDFGYRIASPKSELMHMYYVSLNNVASVKPNCDDEPTATGPINVGPFTNLAKASYWTSVDFRQDPSFVTDAWLGTYAGGSQARAEKGVKAGNAWIMRTGDTADNATPVPTEPAATATPTVGITATPTPAITATPTPTGDVTPTPTAVVTPTPTESGTPTGTPAVTVTPLPTGTETPTAVPTGTQVPTAQPTGTQTPTAQPTGTQTPTAQPTVTQTPTGVPTAVPTLVPTEIPKPTQPPIVIGGGDVTDYDFDSEPQCRIKGSRRHRWAYFTARVVNNGKNARPGAELLIEVQQDGAKYDDLYVKPRSRVIYARPGRGKTVKALWEVEGEGDVTFNVKLVDGTEADDDDSQDMVSCTLDGKDFWKKKYSRK